MNELQPVDFSIKSAWWAKLFTGYSRFVVYENVVRLPDGRDAPVDSEFCVRPGLLNSARIEVRCPTRGLVWTSGRVDRVQALASIQSLNSPKHAPRIRELAQHASELFGQPRFVSQSELQMLMERVVIPSDETLVGSSCRVHPMLDEQRRIARSLVCDGEETRRKHNDQFVVRALAEHRDFFDVIEANPLTARQRDAIVGNEDANLVVAGAGTGKTSTIVARIAYLLRDQIAKPEQILTIAFARKAREELESRAAARIGAHGTTISTFHALGLAIVGRATGRRPTVSVLASDDHALDRFITEALERLVLQNSSTALTFLTEFGSAVVNPYDFATLDEYYQKVRAGDLRTIRGDKVASRQEVRIANWFFTNQIHYSYEEKYTEVETGTGRKRRYQPDFALARGVYLEHFAVAPDETEPEIFKGYKAEAEWKRRLHKEGKTTLFETYSRDFADGTWRRKLEAICTQLGLKLIPMEAKAVLEHLRQQGCVKQAARLLRQFLHLFKESESSTKSLLEALADVGGDIERNRVFLGLFEEVRSLYEAELRRTDAIDFSDMISLARSHVASGRFVPPWTHIVIDEFQDISRGRASLLAALQQSQSQSHVRVFAVGDDWQSIFRFAGSDVAVMARDFSRFFGCTRRVDLDRTFRYGTSLLDTTSSFVSRNPDQLQKTLVACGPAVQPGVRVVQFELGDEHEAVSAVESEAAALQLALDNIAEAHEMGGRASVLLLGRYNQNRDVMTEVRVPPAVDLQFMTCHSSKGLEADYAIVCDMTNTRKGFPSEIESDPVLELVLRPDSQFAFAEERRVFYVAMTRAKRQCILLTPAKRMSRFVVELLETADPSQVEIVPEPVSESVKCLDCGGRMIARDGQHGAFWSCHNFPRCTGKRRLCPVCKRGTPLRKANGQFQCNLTRCRFVGQRCPSAECDGMLIPRAGKFGDFLGCTNYPACRRTRDG